MYMRQIMGITTIAKLSSEIKPMEDIRKFLESLCSDVGGRNGDPARKTLIEVAAMTSARDASKQFSEIVSQNTSGLLVNERLINIPASVVAPLLQQLKTDYEDAVRANKWPKYSYLVYFIKMYQIPLVKGHKATSAENKNAVSEELFEFVSEEDQLISQMASCYIDYNISHQHAGAPCGGKWSSDKEMIPYRRVCLLELTKFWALLPELEQLKTDLGNINITPLTNGDDDEEYVDKK